MKDNLGVTWPLHSADLEVWSKLARTKHITSKFACDFDSDWQLVSVFSHCVTLIRFLLPHIISYSNTKVLVLVVMECKRAHVIHVYELTFLLHTFRSTEYIFGVTYIDLKSSYEVGNRLNSKEYFQNWNQILD